VLFVIADHVNHQSELCTAGMATIADEAGLASRETASRVTSRLLALGVILTDGRSVGGRGRTTAYSINYDLKNCDPGITVCGNRAPETVTPPSRFAPVHDGNRDLSRAETVIARAKTVTAEAVNCDPAVTRRAVEGFGREKEKGTPASPFLEQIKKEKSETTACPDCGGLIHSWAEQDGLKHHCPAPRPKTQKQRQLESELRVGAGPLPSQSWQPAEACKK
jgi:hypothetical protein